MDMLPEDVLLEISDWYLDDNEFYNLEGWQTLAHVCRKWRNVVFGSPRRLNLRLLCAGTKPVRKNLDIWPRLPIIVLSYYHKMTTEDNIVAALEHKDRVCRIMLEKVSTSLWEGVLAATQEPFPALTDLELHTSAKEPKTVSDSFLGGSAPTNLRYLRLSRVPFPGLPKLLSSATHLVTLHLLLIPHSGYVSPETMVTALSALTRLKEYCLEFRSPRSCPERGRRRPPPPTRSVLPALTEFIFAGVSEYLEDLVARIDTPLLDRLEITFFRQLIFHTPRLAQFIGRTPNLMAHDEAHATFSSFKAEFTLPRTRTIKGLNLEIHRSESDWQLSVVAQICSSSLPLIPSSEHLYVHENEVNQSLQPRWQDDIENVQWLELLHPSAIVKALYLSRNIAAQIAPALGELIGARAAEVLPALQSLFLEELHPLRPVQEAIDKFVATRQLSDHPIVISHWDRKQIKR
jgi:hypothetical protein